MRDCSHTLDRPRDHAHGWIEADVALPGTRESRLVQPTLRENLLGWLVNPNIALLLLVGGALLIYLEFNTPGTIVPGALGTLMVLLGIFALDLLPIRFTAVLLLFAALALMLLEAKFGGHGVLAIAGIVCLLFGTLTLVAAPIPELRDQSLGGNRRKCRIRRHHGLSGAARVARSAHEGCASAPMRWSAARPRRWSRLHPKAMCWSRGIWRAVASEPVPAGTRLRVVGHEQYLLRVDAVWIHADSHPATAA